MLIFRPSTFFISHTYLEVRVEMICDELKIFNKENIQTIIRNVSESLNIEINRCRGLTCVVLVFSISQYKNRIYLFQFGVV